jgi:membrane protease subunit (stomatin/prohibitin family)
MIVRLSTLALVSVLACAPQFASAKGCLKGAAVGGVGGHVAGGHGVAGAAVGCVVGRHMANKKEKQQQASQAQQANQAPAPQAPAKSNTSQ